MRNSPWFLLLLAASSVTLAGMALLRPSLEQVDGTRQSPWDLLLEWRHQGHIPTEAAGKLLTPRQQRNGILQGLHIQVRVEDENGLPLQGASIVCTRFLTHSLGRVDVGTTNSDGEFASTRLVHGNYEVQVQMPGYLPAEPQHWLLPSDGDAPKTIRLSPACTLTGSIIGLDGLPQNHGVLMMAAQGREQQIQLKIDGEGEFSFSEFPSGPWVLSWKPHTEAVQNDALTKAIVLTENSASKVQIILPAELIHPPSEDPEKGIGIYSVETN